MSTRMTLPALLLVGSLCRCACAIEDALLEYDFAAVAEAGMVGNLAGAELSGELRGTWAQTALPEEGAGSVLTLDGESGFVEVPGSAGVHIGEQGFTVVATVRLADSGTVEGAADSHDMILFKNQEYLFGRTAGGRRLYFNIHDGKGWSASVTGGECRPDVWTHVAAVVERINEPPQGRVGYHIGLYQDGELVAGREILNITSARTEGTVNIGKGWGGPWFLRGDIARVAVYPRAITEGELNRLLRAEKLAKVRFRHVAEPDPRYLPLLAETQEAVAAAGPERRRALERLVFATVQAVNHMDSEAEALPCLQTIQRLARDGDGDPQAAFRNAHTQFELLDGERIGLTFYAPRASAVALCGLFDLEQGREVLGRQQALWALEYRPPGGGDMRVLEGDDRALTSTVTVDRQARSAVLRWRHTADEEHPLDCEAACTLRLDGPRLSLRLEVDNDSPQVALRRTRFPLLRLRRLEEGTDQLLVPRMSGVVHPNPVGTRMRYEGDYPSGAAHMQFLAYYDDGRGVYVGCEDPKAWSKTLLAGAAGEDCEMAARWFVGCPGEGGNGFSQSGEVAVELFEGDWFDAARLYKRFARTAAWWPASRSREDTPRWYRDLTLWFIGNANTEAAERALIEQRRSLGLPVGLHWYGWNTEKFDDDYPHFTAREGFSETVARLQAEGIYVKPYINARLWETRDRGDEDYQYTSVALPATLKEESGEPYIEVYAKRSFSPMCPATPLWQRTMADLCSRLADRGVGAIYLDQVSAARPRPCFDKGHPHAAGAGEAWLEQGYWPMLATIRSELRATHPNVALNSEDAAEPYMHLMDGYLPWRFLDVGHVPAYQAIYAGRIQLTSRHFDDTSYEAQFPKAAEQMLYGEQIGWFSVGKLAEHPAFGAFVKKLAYTRRAFLPFFNEGDMEKPAALGEPTPSITADWGFYGPRIISTPAVLHSVWRLGDSMAVLFANTTCDPVTFELTPRPEAWGLEAGSVQALEFSEGAAPIGAQWQRGETRSVTVPGYGLSAWLLCSGDASAAEHQSRVAAVSELFLYLRQIDDETGMTPERKRAELQSRDPWLVPEVPVRSAAEWISAAEAPKLVRARASEDESFVGWIANEGSLCFGPIDLGQGEGTAVVECEVGVPDATTNGRLLVMEAIEGHGETLAETGLAGTGGYHSYETVRLALPAGTAGERAIVLQVRGSGSGICNIRRWRVVWEPPEG